ncbi:unnamed protein product [Blumeria hordei]|uniref:Uncharacterized protein n=2 Tax=Blumeria hordei TaxID=2867405 RepID=A0A383UG73_BLUHO|nr:hypothetical protein BGHDH14_bgh05720 [Blumeria hordei DH14]SZE99288.1 unnamed protein product [Blumeria hordei]
MTSSVMTTQDELVALFQQHLSLHHNSINVHPKVEEKSEEPIIYSISQHYHHSAHLAPEPSNEPPLTEKSSTEMILLKKGVDTCSLYPSQLELFETATTVQQKRLIELWQICRPDLQSLTLEQNGWAERAIQEQQKSNVLYESHRLENFTHSDNDLDHGMDSDMSDCSTKSPVIPTYFQQKNWDSSHSAEPYITSGYGIDSQVDFTNNVASRNDTSNFGTILDASQYTHATDPVYNKAGSFFGEDISSIYQREQEQRSQYGALQKYSNYNLITSMGEDEEML